MASKIELRKLNRNLIYRCIYESDGISRQEVAARTGVSIPTVIQNLTDLEGRGLITTDGVFESTGGRRAKVLRCVGDAAYAIGIDVTQNHLTIVCVNMFGDIACGGTREYFPYKDEDAYYDEVARKLESLLEEAHIDRARILGVGISLPCIVDRESHVTYGSIVRAPYDMQSRFASRLSYPVELFNDANSGGFAETWNTDAEEMRFYLMLSNSVGGAIINGNEIYLGDHCRSAEIGHTRIIPRGKQCYCGQHGCVNAYCSALLLSEETGGSLAQFFAGVDAGEKHLRKIFHTYLDHLALTVTNLRMLFDCEIILGGYVGAYMEHYMDELTSRLLKINPYESVCDYVKPCRYKVEASAVGAGLPFINRMIEDI